MRVVNLVANSINHKKIRNISARVYSDNEVIVTFYLPIPAFVNDSKLITSENTSIIYRKNSKKNISKYEVGIYNVKDPYPEVSNNKVYAVSRKYNIKDWIMITPGIFTYLSSQREEIFREVKSNILLEKIGVLSKQWQGLTDGKPSYEVNKPFIPYSSTVPRAIITNNGKWIINDPNLPF